MVAEQQIRAYVDYLRDMGIYDLYQREDPKVLLPDGLKERIASVRSTGTVAAAVRAAAPVVPEIPRAPSAPRISPVTASSATAFAAGESQSSMPKAPSLDTVGLLPVEKLAAGDRAAALEGIRADIGECTRCPLAYAGRRNIVFGDGDPNARLMFVGEGPGADEDESGLPFVGKAGQLLNNMIAAMGLNREQVYIANIVKCRPPGNRTPEFVEATTCSQFLARQIDVVRPEVIVALGATAATYLLGVKQPLATLRGQWFSVRGSKVAVTYHPAFLLRDPRQKGEAWKDLQRVMVEMGLSAPRRAT
jgi:uracil-DNA glycosylase family 4